MLKKLEQQQQNKAFDKDDAFETLGIINTWIGNIDTKVSFSLALSGALLGLLTLAIMDNIKHRIDIKLDKYNNATSRAPIRSPPDNT